MQGVDYPPMPALPDVPRWQDALTQNEEFARRHAGVLTPYVDRANALLTRPRPATVVDAATAGMTTLMQSPLGAMTADVASTRDLATARGISTMRDLATIADLATMRESVNVRELAAAGPSSRPTRDASAAPAGRSSADLLADGVRQVPAPMATIMEGHAPSIRESVSAVDLDQASADSFRIADPIDMPRRLMVRALGTRELDAQPTARGSSPALPTARGSSPVVSTSTLEVAPRPVAQPLETPSVRLAAPPWGRAPATPTAMQQPGAPDGAPGQIGVREEAALERGIEGAQARIEGAARTGEDPTPIVAQEQRRIATTQTGATQRLRQGERRHRQRQQTRRQAAARRAATVRRSAAAAAARRRREAQRRHAANVARVRAELARLQQAQLARLANLRVTERQRIATALQAAFDAQRAAAEQERNATRMRIVQEHQAIVTQINNSRVLIEQTRAQRELALVTAHARAVAEARTSLTNHIANLTALGEQGAAGCRATGQSEAQRIRETARAEASTIEATGQRLAARARSEGGVNVPREQRAQARARASARARQIIAHHAARARARIARGNADAQQTIASYEARAREHIARINQMIAIARQETATALTALGQRLEQDKQRLLAERDRWLAVLELQRRAFLARAARELHQLDVYFEAQRLAAERDHRERFQAAIRAFENDYARLRAEVTRNVLAQIAALQARMQNVSAEDLARIEHDLVGAQMEIERQVGRISERANREVEAFTVATQQRTQAIRARGRDARESIGRMGAIARGVIAQTNAQRQRTMGRRGQPADRREHPIWQMVDRNNGERYRVQNDESYRLRRYARTGEVEITADNAEQTRLTLAGAVRGRNDSSRIFQTLATRTPEELRILFGDADFREQFLRDLGSRDRAVVQQMMAARSPERVRALALQWAADGGLTGIGTDDEVMRRVFAASTTDAERAQLNREYQHVDSRAASAAHRRPMPGRTIEQMIADETRWSTTTSADRGLLLAQQRGDETEIAAHETIAAYQGGGYFGIGSDDDRVIRVRNDIRRRFAGPFRTPAEAQQARRDEAIAMARLDQISREQTGRSLRELDTGETEGPVLQALDASTQTVEVVDPANPTGPRRTVHRPDWTQFRARVAESGVGSDYDTRRVELAYAESTPDERRAINEQFARNHNGVTFDQYVQSNMGVSRRMSRDGRMVESTHSRAGIDRRAALEMSRDGELRSDTLILQMQYGRGRGSEADRTSIDRRLGSLSDGELATLRTDYRNLVDSLGMGQSAMMRSFRNAVHQQQYIGMDPLARFTGWATEQFMDSVSGPTGDIILDLRSTASARQHRLWSYLLTTGRADTAAERIAQDSHMLADLGPAPSPGTFNSWLEGWEGRAARRNAANLRTQYTRLQQDGTANLTADQATRQLAEQVRTGQITPEEYRARLQRLGAFGQEADRSQAAQDATVSGRTATLRMVATTAGQVVTVVAGIAITIGSGGTLTGPYIAAISAAAGGLTTIGISYATLGDNYDRRDFMADASSTIVGVVASGLLPVAALERYAQNMILRAGVSSQVAREILASAVVASGTGMTTELAAALLDERTYVGTSSEIWRRLLERIRDASVTGAINGARDTAIIGTYQRWRQRRNPETTDTDTETPASADRDQSADADTAAPPRDTETTDTDTETPASADRDQSADADTAAPPRDTDTTARDTDTTARETDTTARETDTTARDGDTTARDTGTTSRDTDTTSRDTDTTDATARDTDSAPKETLLLPAPERPLALPAPERPLALPAPERPLALPAPERPLALPAPERPLALPAPQRPPALPAPEPMLLLPPPRRRRP